MRIYISSGRLATLALLLQLAFATNASASLANSATSKRAVYYYQNAFSSGHNNTDLISLLPLISEKKNRDAQDKPFATDVLVGAFHLGPQADKTTIHLNGLPPNNSIFTPLWNETAVLQKHGVNINMFLGGWHDQSFVNLASNFSYYYPILKKTLQTYNFNGIDLDVEDNLETTSDIKKVILQLRHDFGKEFVITLAPVATDLMGGGGLSLIDYKQLHIDLGSNISWFNVQFYSGFGSLETPSDYATIVTSNGFPADVVVGGMMANQANGAGYVNVTIVAETVESLVNEYPTFGGVAAWEYFNADPGGTADPAEWATYFAKAMGR